MFNYSHGGDIYSFEDTEILDFSANINPFGMSESIKSAIIKAVNNCDIYPDSFCRKLRSAISVLEGLSYDYIFCSNGAADIIYRLVLGLKPKRALLAVPSFTEYESALKTVDCDIEYFYMHEDKEFKLDRGFLDHLTDEIDIMFLCNPNNPTGHITDKALLEEIISICEQKNIIAVVDECFIDFLDNSKEYSLKNCVEKYKNIVVLKAFTKLYAMAGVRLGYCFTANENIMKLLYSSGQPWAVSQIAQQAGIAAASEYDFVKNTIKIIASERERLKIQLIKSGFKVYNSKANFIFFKSDNTSLKEDFLKHKILIRSCENYKGLEKGYYRIAVKSPNENDVFINILRKIGEANG